MEEAVSDVLDLRMRESDGLSRMVLLSLVAHAVLLAAIVLMPATGVERRVQAKSCR